MDTTNTQNDIYWCIRWSSKVYTYSKKPEQLIKYVNGCIKHGLRYYLQKIQSQNKEMIEKYDQMTNSMVSGYIKENTDNFPVDIQKLVAKYLQVPLYKYRIVGEELNGIPLTPDTDEEFEFPQQ